MKTDETQTKTQTENRSLSELPLSKVNSMLYVLERVGITQQDLINFPLAPLCIHKRVAEIIRYGDFGLENLIEGMFIPPEQQLDFIKQCNSKRIWGFNESDFTDLGEPPAWPKKRLCVVILDVSLNTVQQTFKEAWYFAAIIQSKFGMTISYPKWLKTDSSHLKLLSDDLHKRGLRWRTIDLSSNKDDFNGISPRKATFLKNKTFPSSSILWAVSFFPFFFQSLRIDDNPNAIWIPGYEIYPPRWDNWPWNFGTFCLYNHPSSFGDNHEVNEWEFRLDVIGHDRAFPGWSIPVFIDENANQENERRR